MRTLNGKSYDELLSEACERSRTAGYAAVVRTGCLMSMSGDFYTVRSSKQPIAHEARNGHYSDVQAQFRNGEPYSPIALRLKRNPLASRWLKATCRSDSATPNPPEVSPLPAT